MAGGKANDISMSAKSSTLDITGSHLVSLDGGINNISNSRNGIINNYGTLDINTASIYANEINFGKSSALYVKVKDEDNYGQIFANNINIDPEATMKVSVSFAAQNKQDSFTASILNADNLNGSFIQMPDIASNELFDITYLENGQYQITKKAQSPADKTDNNKVTSSESDIGEAWLGNGNFAPGSAAANTAEYLFDLKQNNPELYKQTLQSLAPSTSDMAYSTIKQINRQIFSAVSSQLSTALQGLSAGEPIFKLVRSWVKLMTNHAKLSGRDGFSANASGISMGADKEITDDLRLGLGYAHSRGKIDSFLRQADIQTHSAILYSEYKPSDWFINTIAVYNHSVYRENQHLSGLHTKSHYDMDSFGLQMLNGIEYGNIAPQAGFRYTYFRRHGYQDTAGQFVSGTNSQNLSLLLGSKFSEQYQFSDKLSFKPEIKLFAVYDTLRDQDNAIVFLPNGASYRTETKHLNPLGLEAGSKLNLNYNGNIDISLGYEGNFREDYQDHSGILDFKYTF